MPVSGQVDWDGNGSVDTRDEWIELYNTDTTRAINLAGWTLQATEAVSGTAEYVFPAGTVLPRGGYLVLYRPRTGLASAEAGATITLLRPNGMMADTVSFGPLATDTSYSFDQQTGVWRADWPPSPGRANSALPDIKQRRLPQ